MKTLKIGRNQGNDIMLNDPYVSGTHCEIIQDDYGAFWLNDHSTNGTLVNGSMCHGGRMQIYNNSVVRVGNVDVDWFSFFAQQYNQGTQIQESSMPQNYQHVQQPYQQPYQQQPMMPNINIIQNGGNQSQYSSQRSSMNLDASSRQYHPQHQSPQRVVERKEDTRSAGAGIAGFIFSLFGLFPLAFLFSLVGLSRPRKGFAIVGLILSIIEGIIFISIWQMFH